MQWVDSGRALLQAVVIKGTSSFRGSLDISIYIVARTIYIYCVVIKGTSSFRGSLDISI